MKTDFLITRNEIASIMATTNTIEQLQKENEELKRHLNYLLLERMDSDLVELCYHFGYPQDVIGDCWHEEFNKNGMEGLVRRLKVCSEKHHGTEYFNDTSGGHCDVCTEMIENIENCD